MNEVEMQVALARLTQVVESGFKAIDDRFEDQHEQSRHQHSDNVARMDRLEGHAERIEAEVRKTNGRVTRVEEQIKTIFRTIEKRAAAVATDLGERTGVTRRDVGVYLAGGGSLIAAWKFVEWASRVLKGLP